MRRLGLGLFVIGTMCFIDFPLFALNSEMNRVTLQGLRGVWVVVEDLTPEVGREGLVKDQLKKSVATILTGLTPQC